MSYMLSYMNVLLSFMCVPEYMFATDQTTNFAATVYVFCDSTMCQIYVCRGYFLSLGIFLPCSFPSSAGVTSAAHKVLNFRAHRRGGSDILTWFENKYGDDVQQLEVLELGDVLQEQGVNI